MAVVLEGWCSLPAEEYDPDTGIPHPYLPRLSSEVTEFSGDYVGESLCLYVYSPYSRRANKFQQYSNSTWSAVTGVSLYDKLPFAYKIYLVKTSDFGASYYTWANSSTRFEILSLGKYNCLIQGSDGTQYYWAPDATPLSTPTGLNATNVTSNSARTNWQAVENASNYKVQYKAAGDTVWTETYTD